ncbi:MAG: hypothetical protein ACMV1K_10365 [Sulfurospirillum sp.]
MFDVSIEKNDNDYYAICSLSYQSTIYGGNVLVEIDLNNDDKDQAKDNLSDLIDEVIQYLEDAKALI